jgi:hypothetical protein
MNVIRSISDMFKDARGARCFASSSLQIEGALKITLLYLVFVFFDSVVVWRYPYDTQ